MDRPVSVLRPRDVPGFVRAAQAGIVAHVPREPPRALPGPTGHQVFRAFLIKSAVTVSVVLLLLEALPRIGVRPGVSALVAALAGVLGLGVIYLRWWGDVGRRNVEEMAAGYTTFRMQYGSFWWGGHGHREPELRTPWDYSGLWVLDGTGRRVLSAPDPNVDPPGFYPSPNRPGAFELWTGAAWLGRYRDSSLFADR